ncbi:MAG: hypothetical protein D3926_04825 [Desulfobacteraceae bacterium]|nr:MAG: hypothetical protein D3926_04825 [Desulfobacteraceae bacterium]
MSKDRVVSADKMMNKAKGPVWHKKQKDQGIIPKGLRGIDKEATWCKSKAAGWVYGHGSFSMTSHQHPVLGCFLWMQNSANEAKRMWLETFHIKDHVDYIAMDSKADDASLFREFKRQRQVNLITSCRANMDKTTPRKKMIAFMSKPEHKKIYRERACKVEPMQGLVKDIFELDRCWMRGDDNNRWLLAAMGLTIQMHQLQAFKQGRSTWNIKEQVLG